LSCNAPLEISYNLLIEKSFGWKERFGAFAAEAKKFYKIGIVGKSHDGGWPSLVVVTCQKCVVKYLVYAGIEEVYNSIHTVTIQGITELIDLTSDDGY